MVGVDGHGGWRGHFSSVEEMDETLIENWNAKVTRADIVYHLGDLSFHKPEKTAEILKRLNGQIHLIRGNHDKTTRSSVVREQLSWIGDYKSIKIAMNPAGLKKRIVMSHYAMVTWHGSSHGSWMLHGHSHGNLVLPYPMDIAPRVDVGVDVHNMTPVSLDEIIEIMQDRKYVPIDHHGRHEGYAPGISAEYKKSVADALRKDIKERHEDHEDGEGLPRSEDGS